MGIRDIFSMAVQEERCQRRYTRLTLVFMTIALLLVIGVNSVVGSVRESTKGLMDQPMARIRFVPGPQDMILEYKEVLIENLEREPMIGDVFESTSWQQIFWKDSGKTVGQNNAEIEIFSWFSGMEDYLDKGGHKPEYGEIVLPQKLYNTGNCDAYNYVSTEELIGTEITLEMETSDSGNMREERLKVVGTYDNIASSNQNIFLMNDQQVIEWYRASNEITESEIADVKNMMKEQGVEADMEREIQEVYGGNEMAFWMDYLEVQTNICVYINPEYSMEEAEEKLQELIGTAGIPERVLDTSLILYFNFIIYLGNLIAILLLVATAANILIMVSAEMKRRKGEFALKQSVGYRKYHILIVFAVGKFLCFFKAACVAAVLTLILNLAGNYVIQSIFPFYLRHIHLSLAVSSLLTACFVVVGGIFLGLLTATFMLNRMSLTEVLKREESA